MRIVIKVGTSTLAHSTGLMNVRRVELLCSVLSDLKNAGHEVVLVSSGAIGMGVGKLSLGGRPSDIPTKQAAAAVGQCELMYTYDRLFSTYNHTVAQILVTAEDIAHEERKQNFKNTLFRLLELHALPIINDNLERLLEYKALPIINENDTVATREIVIGDNDTLGAVVATAIHADLLVILSDIDGLYTADPHTHADAQLLPTVEEITAEIEAMTGGAGSALGTGGMATKLHAAHIATEGGVEMVIANGRDPAILYDIVEGKPVGTHFKAKEAAR